MCCVLVCLCPAESRPWLTCFNAHNQGTAAVMNVGDEDVMSGFATLLPGAEGDEEEGGAGEQTTTEKLGGCDLLLCRAELSVLGHVLCFFFCSLQAPCPFSCPLCPAFNQPTNQPTPQPTHTNR